MTLLLGLNKQLDLQLLLTRVGKRLVYGLGLYDFRWAFRIGVFFLTLVVGGVAVLYGVRTLRHASSHLRWAFMGLAIVLLYITIRAALFQHVSSRLAGPLSLQLEPLGLAVTTLAAWLFVRTHRRTRPA